jgi:negative regulator of replication initiation
VVEIAARDGVFDSLRSARCHDETAMGNIRRHRGAGGRKPAYRPRMFAAKYPRSAYRRWRGLVLWALAVVVSGGCSKSVSTQLADARATVAQLRATFTKASDASNRAVMADTDALSQTYSDEAVVAVRGIDQGVAALRPTLDSLGYAEEMRNLDEFVAAFDKYRTFDKEVRALAVENTNLKAQRLSFGIVREEADAIVDALSTAAHSVPVELSARFAT